MITVNLNVDASAVLSEAGAQVLNQFYELGTLFNARPRYRAGETITVPLWELMRLFGPAMSMAKFPPFAPNEISLRETYVTMVPEPQSREKDSMEE